MEHGNISGGIEIIIEGEPVAQGRPRMTRSGHVFTPQKSREYREKVVLAARKKMNGQMPVSFALCVEIIVCRGIPISWSKKKRQQALQGEIKPVVKSDIDNYCKMVMDGMNGIVYVDDAQVVQLKAEKIYAKEPKVIARVYPVF